MTESQVTNRGFNMLKQIESLLTKSKTIFTRSEILSRAICSYNKERIRKLNPSFEEISANVLRTRKKLSNENKNQDMLDFIYDFCCQEFKHLTKNDLLNWAIQCNQQPQELYRHLENGADINGKDSDDWYAMDIAVLYGRRAHINFLIENGASPRPFAKKDSWHPIPLLHHASRQKHFC
jgi:hypothetical protein